jgi:predicted RNA-binding Zn-ribbon protein involved in translation (DUF1610 family)
MDTFSTECFFPCLCQTCRKVSNVNLLQKRKPKCFTCKKPAVIPYDDPSLVKRQAKKQVASWSEEKVGRVLILTRAKYLCPNCGKFALQFEEGGLEWD